MLMITAAAAAILDAANRSGAEGMALRLAARPGEDGTLERGLGFVVLRGAAGLTTAPGRDGSPL